MCGIAGIISSETALVQQRSLKKMSDVLAHRGPDGEGLWINKKNTAGLSHRRLAIIDLTDAGAQPMHYADRYTIVYNGEIYNYKEIRSDLKQAGYYFKSESDTEVILAAYHLYKENCVKYFDGMFAFAIWDEQEQILFCARDTFGEKPFYYFIDKTVFVFASEMKALWAVGIDKTADDKMMVNYLVLGHVQNAADKSQTFYKDIFSLPPAHTGTLSLADMQFVQVKYRDINKENTIKINENTARGKFEELLAGSVKRRLRSDVPVGSSLSGGLDSTSIAYFINRNNKSRSDASFQTFSAIFPGFEKDESQLISEITNHFKFKNAVQ